MSAVENFYQATLELLKLLEDEQSKDRDEKINKIRALLEKREGLMITMSPPFSQEDRELGKKLISLNQKVIALLIAEKTSIQKDINSFKKKKQTVTKYSNPYESLSTIDGVFYDKRK